MLNKERIALAHQIIDGIPDNAIKLHSYRVKTGKSLACGTICCAAGWLALHPAFNEMGLYASAIGSPWTRNFSSSSDALAEIFGDGAFMKLFVLHGKGWYDRAILENNKSMTDKELVLARMKKAYYEEQ